jgi:hypothetical protein
MRRLVWWVVMLRVSAPVLAALCAAALVSLFVVVAVLAGAH